MTLIERVMRKYGCRCEPCATAESIYQRTRRQSCGSNIRAAMGGYGGAS